MSVFNPTPNDATREPMFFGQEVNVSRYDVQRYEVFEKLTEKQLSFFWRPNEVDVSKDRIDFRNKLMPNEQHIFTSNLKYQTLLDSIQGRSPNLALLPIVSLPELETWIETWSFSETIHSRSYTHIIRNVMDNPGEIFDDIVVNEHILKRAKALTRYYDDLIQGIRDNLPLYEVKRRLYLCIMAINVLEGVRFYVSFACSFAFAERELMEGNAKIIKLIARDEALHLAGTQQMLSIMRNGLDDMEMAQIASECEDECYKIFAEAAIQEKEWAEYLMKDGSMIGLNYDILSQYIDHLVDVRMQSAGLKPFFGGKVRNPIPWINSWLSSDNVQVAPQEAEISSYLTGQVDASVSQDDFSDFEL